MVKSHRWVSYSSVAVSTLVLGFSPHPLRQQQWDNQLRLDSRSQTVRPGPPPLRPFCSLLANYGGLNFAWLHGTGEDGAAEISLNELKDVKLKEWKDMMLDLGLLNKTTAHCMEETYLEGHSHKDEIFVDENIEQQPRLALGMSGHKRTNRRKRTKKWIEDSSEDRDLLPTCSDRKELPGIAEPLQNWLAEWREVYSRKNGKNAVNMVHKDSNTSESLEDIIEFFGRRNCDARALFDALMKRKLLLSSIDNLTAGVQALCRLGWSDLAVHLYNAADGVTVSAHLGCDLAIVCLRNGLVEEAKAMRKSLLESNVEGTWGTEEDGKFLSEELKHYIGANTKSRTRTGTRFHVIKSSIDLTGIRSVLCRVFGPNASSIPTSTYNTFIRLLGRAGLMKEVFEVLTAMKQAGVTSDKETLEFVANAIVKDVSFVCQSTSMKGLPRPGLVTPLPEIVFVGRSNVGKSSLVNMLLGRKSLAPTSDRPGYTQRFNYYGVNLGRDEDDKGFYFVDVPGLGFAVKAGDGQRDSWRNTLQRFLAMREPLTAVFHLMDSRVGPEEADLQLIRMIKHWNNGRSKYIVVITKLDKVTSRGLRVAHVAIKQALVKEGWDPLPQLIDTSAKSKEGRDHLWLCLASAIGINS